MKNIIILTASDVPQFKREPIQALHAVLAQAGYEIVYPHSKADAFKLIEQNPRIAAVLFDWDDFGLALCGGISKLNEQLPLFGFANQNTVLDVSMSHLRLNLNFFEYHLGQAQEVFAKIEQGIETYIDSIMPPFTKALFKYAKKDNFVFCTPGHLGGSAFQSHPAGSIFYDFYGANSFKTDVSVSMTELGSLLDHSGPHKEAEEFIASTFNATRSYIVTNGTSTANKVVGMFAAPAGSSILVDRNCHKSLTHLLMMSNVTPLYFRPTRNAYGIIGGIPKQEFTREAIEAKMASTPNASWPCYAVITNSTYDGLLYNTGWIKRTLEVKHLHFDSAWVPYTNFHPIYLGKYGMSGEVDPGKVVYETQSTHKLLAAFSQASMIHIKGEVDHETFNETYMMHTATSPLYSIVASAEMSAAMMKGNPGRRLIEKSIDCALNFRKEVNKLRHESKGWFFDVWQPDALDQAECWPLKPGESWHGFKNIDAEHMYLDPVKVTILTPGMSRQNTLEETGIPATIVAKYLDENGVVVEKVGPYNMLFLFSIGIDKSKSLKLLHVLTEFKRCYDLNLKVKNCLPSLYQENPAFYQDMRIQELAQGIHKLMRQSKLPDMMFRAFEVLPVQAMTPHQAFQCVLKGQSEEIYIEALLGQVNADMILPYPPGVPLVLPGETLTEDCMAVLDFLLLLIEIGEHYPGFDTDIHGAYRQKDGRYKVKVIKQ